MLIVVLPAVAGGLVLLAAVGVVVRIVVRRVRNKRGQHPYTLHDDQTSFLQNEF